MQAPTAVLRRDGAGRIVTPSEPPALEATRAVPPPVAATQPAVSEDVRPKRGRWLVVGLGILAIATGTGALTFHLRTRPGEPAQGRCEDAARALADEGRQVGDAPSGTSGGLRLAPSFPAAASDIEPSQSAAAVERARTTPPLQVVPASSGTMQTSGAGQGPQLAVLHVPGTSPSPPPAGASATQPPRGWATVTVDVFPTVLVRLDGRSQGEVSGQRSFRVAAGAHRLEFVHAHRSRRDEVQLAAGEQRTLTFNAFRAQ